MTGAPLVTMVILAFNQERFVEAAVKAAFAQDYPNLEIILSDDRSTDSTSKILQDLAASYRGPHRIVLNQTSGGGGILAHFYAAVEKSQGRFIVGAAGDDLSYPHRVSRLAQAWQATGADAVYSAFDRIDEDGRPITGGGRLQRSDYDAGVYFTHGHAPHLHGVSAAYDRRVFEAIELPPEPVMAEDYFFSLMLGLRSRKVVAIDEPLVAYRVHRAALTSADESTVGLAEVERRFAESGRWLAALLRQLEQVSQSGEGIDPNWGSPAKINLRRLRSDLRFLDYRSRWLSASFPERLFALARYWTPRRSRWLLLRLFGVTGQERVKRWRAMLSGGAKQGRG